MSQTEPVGWAILAAALMALLACLLYLRYLKAKYTMELATELLDELLKKAERRLEERNG